MFEHGRARSSAEGGYAKNASQRRYMEEIEKHDMMFAVGPGGTGKTYIAVAMAVSALLTSKYRIILARRRWKPASGWLFAGHAAAENRSIHAALYDALYDMLTRTS